MSPPLKAATFLGPEKAMVTLSQNNKMLKSRKMKKINCSSKLNRKSMKMRIVKIKICWKLGVWGFVLFKGLVQWLLSILSIRLATSAIELGVTPHLRRGNGMRMTVYKYHRARLFRMIGLEQSLRENKVIVSALEEGFLKQ